MTFSFYNLHIREGVLEQDLWSYNLIAVVLETKEKGIQFLWLGMQLEKGSL